MSNSAFPNDVERLAPEDLELLGRAREQRLRDNVPPEVRERLLRRTLDDTRRAEQSLAVPAAQFVSVQPRGFGFALGWGATLAFGLVLVMQLRGWLRGPDDAAGDAAVAGETEKGSDGLAEGGRLFQSSLFHAPAPAFSGALPPAASSLFREGPFSAQSRAWQVRRWDDLKVEPVGAVKHEFVGGGACFELGSGERVVGGWPWPNAGDVAPPPVPLAAGKRYRLVFKAWARDPLPAEVLIGLGHDRVPFSAWAGARVEVSSQPRAFSLNFVPRHNDPSVGIAFLATAAHDEERTRLCLSDVTLTEIEAR